jgi:hypothetical protein
MEPPDEPAPPANPDAKQDNLFQQTS